MLNVRNGELQVGQHQSLTRFDPEPGGVERFDPGIGSLSNFGTATDFQFARSEARHLLQPGRWSMVEIENRIQDVLTSGAKQAEESATVTLTGRLTGPVQVLSQIARAWRIGPSELAALLDYESEHEAKNLLEGRLTLRGRDRLARTKLIFQIHSDIAGLVGGSERVADWLRFRRADLSNQSVLDRLLKGSIFDLLMVKELIARTAGR